MQEADMKNGVIEGGAKLFKALGNEKRLEILLYLLGKELCVSDLQKLVNISQSALSQHLAVLRAEGIVKTRRAAQTIFYSIRSDKTIKILTLADKLYNQPYKF